MEDANVLRIRAIRFFTVEERDRWRQWYIASFSPMLMSTGNFLGSDWLFKIGGETDQYPNATLWYMKNTEDYLDFERSPEWAAYLKDLDATWAGKYKDHWTAVYLLAKRLKGATPNSQDILANGNTPVVLIEGYRMPAAEWNRYHLWLYDWGYQYYIPLLTKLPGVNEYSRWLFHNFQRGGLPAPVDLDEETKYPSDLTIFYFDNIKAFQDFEKSKELALYRKTFKSEFPGIEPHWNVTYQIYRSWRK